MMAAAKRNGKAAARWPNGKRSPQYVNSPLAEVVFEVRFPGEPAVECHRDEFFATIRKAFPNVWVPHVEPGKPLAMQPYHFKSEDRAETVMLAINRFAFTTTRYEGFHAFRPRAVSFAERFCKQYKIDRLSRTGLRYINVIPFLREGRVVPWKRYFTIDLTLPATTADDFLNVGLAFESRCATGAITTRIACGKTEDESREVFILDFDFAKTESLTSRKLETYIDESHEHTKRVFEEIVSESYKAVMRGEVFE